MMGFPQRGEGNLTRATSLCKNFQPNMFNKTKCQNCFRTREAHDLDGGDGINKPKKVLLYGYLFIAPGLDPDIPATKSRKWQRRCFILYENGELAYALDDSINTVPQGIINMYQCSTVFPADGQTGQKFSLGIQTTTATTFIRAETREEKDSWLETLAEYPEINKENERLKQRQIKLAAQHAAREEKYGKLNSKTEDGAGSNTEMASKNSLNQSWPRSGPDQPQPEILKELDQSKLVNSADTAFRRSQSSVEVAGPRLSDPPPAANLSRSASAAQFRSPPLEPPPEPPSSAKRKGELHSSPSAKSIRAGEEPRSARHARPDPASEPALPGSPRAGRTRPRVRASDTGISELSRAGAAQALGIQRSRSDAVVDRSGYSPSSSSSSSALTPLHQNNNNVNSDLPLGLGLRGDPQRRSWRLRSSGAQEPQLPSTKELPSPKELASTKELPSPKERAAPEPVPAPTPSVRSEAERERSSTSESQTSVVSTGSQSSDDFERLDNPRSIGLRVNKAMLDGDVPSPSKRTIERRRHPHNRRGRHTVTVDSTLHIVPSSDESETNKDTPTLKRSNSDPNLADSDDMLKRKQIAMTFPGLFHLKKGWLIKQGDGEQDWSKHWFVLCDNKLSYYKDSQDEDPNSLDGVIELAKCIKASETPVSRNYGFQIELETGVIILAAMTLGIRNNWVLAVNKAIKTAQEDSAKKLSGHSAPKENQQPLLPSLAKPNSLPLPKSPIDAARTPAEEPRPSPLQPARKSPTSAETGPAPGQKSETQVDGKVAGTQSQAPVEPRPPLERRSSGQQLQASPLETLPPPAPSVRSEGRRSSSSSETRSRRGSLPKDVAPATAPTADARRNGTSKEATEPRQRRSSRDTASSSDSSKSGGKSKERRTRRTSRSDKRSPEESAAAVTAALSNKRTSSTSPRKSRSNSQAEEALSPRTEQPLSGESDAKRIDTTVMSLLEQEVDTLKAQLEQRQKDCNRLQQENVGLKAQLNTEQRDHKESFQDLENEQSGYMTQIEQMAGRSRQAELTNQKLQAELRQTRNTCQQLQQQSQQLAGQLDRSREQLQERADLRGRCEDLLRELAASEAEVAAGRASLKAERERGQSLETELTDTWMKLREEGAAGLEVDVVAGLSAKLEEARARLEESEAEAAQKEERIEARLARAQAQFQAESAALQDRLQTALEETDRLRKRRREKSDSVDRTEAATQQAGLPDGEPTPDPRLAELKASVEGLTSQLKTELNARSELQKKYDGLVAQSALQFLEGQGDKASSGSDDNAVRLETELDRAGREIEKLKKDGATEREQRKVLAKALEREQTLRRELEGKISQSTQEVGSSGGPTEQRDSDLSGLRAELKKAKKEREAVNLVRKQLVAAVDSLNAQLSEKDRVIEKVSAEVETRGSQNSKLEQRVRESLSEVARLSGRIESLESELAQASKRSESEASSQRETLQVEQRRLKRHLSALEEQHALEMHNRQSELDTAGERIGILQERAAGLEARLKGAAEARARAENEAAASLLDLQKEEELLRTKSERMEKEVRRLRGELHAAQDNYDELELQFITKREDMKRLEQQHGEQLGQMGYRIQDLTNKLAATERKVRDLSGVDHRSRAGAGAQLTETRRMEGQLKVLESQLGSVETALQSQDHDTSSLLGKIVTVEQQVQAHGRLPSANSSVSSFDAAERPHLSQITSSLSRGSSVASAPCDSVSTSAGERSGESEAPPVSPPADKGKQNFRARFLESKLNETEQKLKEVTRKLVDVTTRELGNRKAYQEKGVSESRLKERLRVTEREVEAVTKELQQVQSNSRTFACAVRASLTDCGQLFGDIRSGLGWVDLEMGLDGAGGVQQPDQPPPAAQQFGEVATNTPTSSSHANMLSCLKSLLTDACHKVDQCKQTALSQQSYIEKQSRESKLLVRGRSAEGNSAGSSFASTGGSSFDSESGSLKLSRQRNPSVIETLERFAGRLSSEVIMLGESTFVLQQWDRHKLAKIQMFLEESDSLSAAMTQLEGALGSELNQSSQNHTSQTIVDLLSPHHLLQAEAYFSQGSVGDSSDGSTKSEFSLMFIDRHSKSRSPFKRQKRLRSPSVGCSRSRSAEQSPVWTPRLDNFSSSLSNTIIKAGQVEYLSKVKKDSNEATPSLAGSDAFAELHRFEQRLEEVSASLQQKQRQFSRMFEEHLKQVIAKLAEVLAHENIRRMKLDKERNRRAGLCVDDDDGNVVFGSFGETAEEVDIASILDSVGPDLVSYAKQIALQEARGTSADVVEDKMLLMEVYHLLQVRVTDFLKKVALERSTCQVVLKALGLLGKKRYAHIETRLEEELEFHKQELLEKYQAAVAEVRRGEAPPCSDGVDLHVMLGDYVGLLGSLVIRKVVVEGLCRHVVEQVPALCGSDRAALSDLDVSLDPTTVSSGPMETDQTISRIPQPVDADYENLAFHLADCALAQAEKVHLDSQYQENWEEIMQKGRYSPIENVTADHARNMAEVRRRYETLLHEEELRHEQELNSLGERYREALSKVDMLEAKLEEIQRGQGDGAGLSADEDVVQRLGEILAELGSMRERLANTQEELAAAEKEHVAEVDAITDAMESIEGHYLAEIQSLKAAHDVVLSGLKREFQERLERLKALHWDQASRLVSREAEGSPLEGTAPDKTGQARNHGDLVLQEKSHREILEELRRSHNQEIKALEEEKDRELDEERRATSITIELLKKAHREELEAERRGLPQTRPAKTGLETPQALLPKKGKSSKLGKASKRVAGIAALHKSHKQDVEQQWANMQQNVSNDVEVVMKRHREVITNMDSDWRIISDKFSRVCAENTALRKEVEGLERSLGGRQTELASWQQRVRQLLLDQKAEGTTAAAVAGTRGLGGQEEGEGEAGQPDWGVDGNDNEKNPLQVLLRFREAELQCINNEVNQLSTALDEAEKDRAKAVEQKVVLEGQHQSQEEHIKQLLLALDELQRQVEVVRTSGEGEAAPDQVPQEGVPDPGLSGPAQAGGGDTAKADVKLRSWIPFLKRERVDSTGKGSRRRTASDGAQTAAKLKKSTTATE